MEDFSLPPPMMPFGAADFMDVDLAEDAVVEEAGVVEIAAADDSGVVEHEVQSEPVVRTSVPPISGSKKRKKGIKRRKSKGLQAIEEDSEEE